MELELFAPIGRTFQNTNPIFQRRIKQFPEYGVAQRAGLAYGWFTEGQTRERKFR
jgi:hypothetical protein